MAFPIQLDALPTHWEQVEATALRKLVAGTGQWCSVTDLHLLDLLGFPSAFVDLRRMLLAAQFRVTCMEALAEGGLHVRRRAERLREWRRASDNADVLGHWAAWLNRQFLLQLDDTCQYLQRLGITEPQVVARVLNVPVGEVERPLRQEDARRVRHSFQRTVEALLPRPTLVQLEARFRHKLQRWQVSLYPRHRVTRAQAFLSKLRGRVPPRVWAAAWRALWNGWATRRRMQGHGGLLGCAFGCVADAPDSIEHYAHCRRLHAILGPELALPRRATPEDRLAEFLGFHITENTHPDVAVRVAVRLAAAYRVHCFCRHGVVARGHAAEEALRQSCREAVRGHLVATRVYDASSGRA